MVSPCGRASHGSCGLVLAYNKNRSARGESDNRVCAQDECNCDLVARATRGLSAHGRARPAQRLPASAPRVRSAPALLCDNHRSRRPQGLPLQPLATSPRRRRLPPPAWTSHAAEPAPTRHTTLPPPPVLHGASTAARAASREPRDGGGERGTEADGGQQRTAAHAPSAAGPRCTSAGRRVPGLRPVRTVTG